jgi:hypothetical protein
VQLRLYIGLMFLAVSLVACNGSKCADPHLLTGSWASKNGKVSLELQSDGYQFHLLTSAGDQHASDEWTVDPGYGTCMVTLSKFPFSARQLQAAAGVSVSPRVPNIDEERPHFQGLALDYRSAPPSLTLGAAPEEVALTFIRDTSK